MAWTQAARDAAAMARKLHGAGNSVATVVRKTHPSFFDKITPVGSKKIGVQSITNSKEQRDTLALHLKIVRASGLKVSRVKNGWARKTTLNRSDITGK